MEHCVSNNKSNRLINEILLNSFAGKANYYGKHVVQKEVLRVAGKHS